MKLLFCVICGTNKNLEDHHIKPVSRGGDNHQHNFITLCEEHHEMIHHIRPGAWNDRKELIKIGREKAKQDGVKFGRKRQYEHLIPDIKFMREAGWGYGTIARELAKSGDEISKSAIRRICDWEKIVQVKKSPGKQQTISVDSIVQFAEKGYGATRIAKIMNIDRTTIYRLIPDFSKKYPKIVPKKVVTYKREKDGQFKLF